MQIRTRRLFVVFLIFFLMSCCDTANRTALSRHVFVIEDIINGVSVQKDGRSLVIYGDPSGHLESADMVLFTHSRRDVVWAGRKLVEAGTTSVVPAMEKGDFTDVGEFWSDLTEKRFHDYNNQGTKIITKPLRVDRTIT